MTELDIVKVVAYAVALAAGISKFLARTRPFWGSMPSWVQRWAPSALLVAGALPAALEHVGDWKGLASALFNLALDLLPDIAAALGLALPGRHTHIPSKRSEEEIVRSVAPPPMPPVGPALLLLAFLAAHAQACSPKPEPCTPSDAAALAAKQLECQQRVETECPNYKRGTCSTEHGAPCPECPAVEECNRWIEERCK